MVSIRQALQLIDKTITVTGIETITAENSTDRILAEPVYAPIDMPPFRQSAMDGYALHVHPDFERYQVVGEIPAGSDKTYELKPGTCVRIFTGAAVPESATAVVMQEDCVAANGHIKINGTLLKGSHIRKQGEQIARGESALEPGTRLTPWCVGFLCALGITQVSVYRRPKIAVIATGSELIKPGQPLTPGKIYESNSYMLASAIKHYNCGEARLFWVHDDLDAVTQSLRDALTWADFILLSGGISAGDYDFAGRAMAQNGVNEIFYKVNQKPGKPLYFGTTGQNQYLFALPGNPSAAITSFLVYVLPAMRKAGGNGFTGLQKLKIPLAAAYTKTDNRAHLLKAFSDSGKIHILSGQNSDMLQSFTKANAIALIPEEAKTLEASEPVELFLL